MADEKAKLIEAAISQIEKDYGKGSIMRLGNRDVLVPVSVIPPAASRSISLWALADSRAAASWKSTARNPAVRPP